MEPTTLGTAAATLLDTRGRACPIPVVLLGKAAREGVPGDRIELLATDAGSVADIPAWADQTGHVLESAEQVEDHYRYVIVLSDEG